MIGHTQAKHICAQTPTHTRMVLLIYIYEQVLLLGHQPNKLLQKWCYSSYVVDDVYYMLGLHD